ncbi:MAG: diguanylate cyclase [Treponema sp.]|nr:diguanylate cyclase [Treponema sp.]
MSMVEEKNSLLVVDDDSTNLMVLSRILQPEYTIYTAKDGMSAIKKAEKFLPDLILLDILMQGMDGYEVLSVLQKSDKARHIPVIFITGLNSLEDEKKGLKLGAVDYINKPFDDTIVKLRVALHIRLINQLHTIEYLSTTDQLTRIPNRRAFDNRLNEEWRRAIREKQPITLLMIDVDHFKRYNDKYGHQQGDKALITIAGILGKTATRGGDFAARWGGEEFVMLLPNSDEQAGLKVGEDLRKGMECTDVPLSDGTVTKMTISIGINSHMPTQDSVLNEFVSGSDKALYTAKKTGRNRVCLYDASVKRAET